jgi:hypothetical protein
MKTNTNPFAVSLLASRKIKLSVVSLLSQAVFQELGLAA